MKKIVYSLLSLFVSIPFFAQEEEVFYKSEHFYIRGNSLLTGNNILGHHATNALMDNSVANDAVKMKYIDIDNDKRTFSSSQASITDVPENSKIVYAVLYWTALYPYNKGRMSTRGGKLSYKGKGGRDADINEILFRTPGKEYILIEGEIIKDGFNSEEVSETAPYVSKADVTDILQNISDVNGIYTVANVRAAEGNIPGGGSAGWMLYVLYENESETLKYFTTYDGLIDVDKKTIDIEFSDFKSLEEGKINPVFGVGALEGDRKIPSDQLLLWSPKKRDFIPLSNAVREERNFFNSSIIIDENNLPDRNPNSSNTLGFDLVKISVDNNENLFFDEASTETTLRFQTRVDRYYVFFVSFEIEIDSDFLEKSEKVSVSENEHEIEAEIETDESLEKSFVFETAENQEGTSHYPGVEIPELSAGYYIISNVFSISKNAEEWKNLLVSKGFTPKSFINPKTGWEYVYLDSFQNPEEATTVLEENKKRSLFEGLWILKVN